MEYKFGPKNDSQNPQDPSQNYIVPMLFGGVRRGAEASGPLEYRHFGSSMTSVGLRPRDILILAARLAAADLDCFAAPSCYGGQSKGEGVAEKACSGSSEGGYAAVG